MRDLPLQLPQLHTVEHGTDNLAREFNRGLAAAALELLAQREVEVGLL